MALTAYLEQRRAPMAQIAIAAALVVTFVYGRWLLLGDQFAGGFAQLFPVTLIASLILDRLYAFLATAGAVVSSFLLFFEIDPAYFSNMDYYGAVLAIVVSVAIIAGIGMLQRRTLLEARATIAVQERLNAELRRRLEHNLDTVIALAPSADRKGSAPDYRKQLFERLSGLTSASNVLRSDIEQQCILPELAEAAVLPFGSHGSIWIKIPRCILPKDCVVPLTLALQEMARVSLESGALSQSWGRVALSGTMLRHGILQITWKETGGRPAGSMPGEVMVSPAIASASGLLRMEAHVHAEGTDWTILVEGTTPR